MISNARAVFCEQGIAGASMDDIAAASGVTKHTIYRRYPSKLSLVNAVIARDLTQLTGAIYTVPRHSDPVSALRELAQRYFRFSIAPENASFASFLLAEAAYSAEMRQNLERWTELYLAPMIAHIEAGQRQGLMERGSPRKWCLLLTDLIRGASWFQASKGEDADKAHSCESFFEERWAIFGQAARLQVRR